MKRRTVTILTLLGMVAALMTGCGSKEAVNVSEESVDKFTGEWIVDAEYAADRVGEDDVLFIDARGEKKAMLGTIEGAVATKWKEWCITEGSEGDETWGCMQSAEEFSQTLGSLGITKDKEIILFGETLDGWGEDARLLWHLRAAGYENVKIVDGGYNALKAYGAQTKMGASKPVSEEVEIAELDYSHVMTTEELLENYDNYIIVDVRTEEEYNGAVLYDEAQGGHLPGAIHIPYLSFFKEDGTLKSKEVLTKMFEEAGLTKEDAIVTYCTGGIRSAYAQIVMEMCGFEKSYNYDQSFWRWAVVGEVE